MLYLYPMKSMFLKTFVRIHHPVTIQNSSMISVPIYKQCRTFFHLVNPLGPLSLINNLHCRLCGSSVKKEYQSSNVRELLDNSAIFENDDEGDRLWSTSPYPKGVYNPRLQSNLALRPKIDPRETSLILFPGEGSQYVGMGQNLLKFPGVRDIFSVANEVLNYDLLSLSLKGPKSKLDETKYAQVAVFVHSCAALEKFKEERPSTFNSCMATAGFGIGELTALTFAGVLSFERAVRLAQLRGEAMQIASEAEPSGLMTVLYRPDTKFHEVLVRAKEHAAAEGVQDPVCEVAHYLFPQCKVVGGHNQCLDFIQKNRNELKINRVRRLGVTGAHHTRLMESAAYTFRQYLVKSNLEEPVIAVHSTVDGKVYRNRDTIVRLLPKQIMKPVKWEQLMHIMYERPQGVGFPNTFECGPGNTLKTILKMVNAKAFDTCELVYD